MAHLGQRLTYVENLEGPTLQWSSMHSGPLVARRAQNRLDHCTSEP